MEYNHNPTHYDIRFTSVFVKDGAEYPFEGLAEEKKDAYRGSNMEFRFIVITLRDYFGDELEFYEDGSDITIAFLSNEQMKMLRGIKEDTFEYPVKYGRSELKFDIYSYSYDKPPCNRTDTCECDKCY